MLGIKEKTNGALHERNKGVSVCSNLCEKPLASELRDLGA